MATSFLDTFNRSDGPVGGNWVVVAGPLNVVDNALNSSSANATGYPSTGPLGPNQAVRIFMRDPGTYPKTVRLRLRWNTLTGDYYQASLQFNSASIACTIAYYDNNVSSWSISNTVGIDWLTQPSCVFSIAQSTLLLSINDFVALAAVNTSLADNGVTGIVLATTGSYVEEYHQYDLTETAGGAGITVVDAATGKYEIIVSNPARNWTPGTPGSPLFEARAGTIDSQVVDDTDTATLQYTAPSLLSDDAIVDPNTGFLFPFAIGTLSQAPTGEGGSGLTTQEHEILLKLETEVDQYLLEQVIYEDPWATLMGAAWWILGHDISGQTFNFGRMVAAILDDAEGLGSIYDRIGLARDDIAALAGAEGYSLFGVQEAITGTASRDLTDVYNLVAALSDGEGNPLDEVLAQLAAIRTANLWTLEHVHQWIDDIPAADNSAVLAELAAIRTASLWTLEHVRQWILDIPTVDYSAELADLHTDVNAIPTNPITSLAPVIEDVADLSTNVDGHAADILSAINSIPTNPITSLQTVLDAIAALDGVVDGYVSDILEAIAAIAGAVAPKVPPVWPGLSGVTLGPPVALSTGVTVTGPMDGVIVQLTSVPPDTEHYEFDTELSYVHIGALAFANDDDALEGFQPFSFGKHLLTPQRMVRASACYLRCALGVVGTVTPWTVTAG